MRHAPGRRLAKLLRILRRKNMKIAKLKRELKEGRMEQPRNEKRKTVITLTEGGGGSVRRAGHGRVPGHRQRKLRKRNEGVTL